MSEIAVERIPTGTTTRFPVGCSQQSAVVLDIQPIDEIDDIRLNLTMLVLPVTFLRPDGRPSGYSMGCREANFSLSVHPGRLLVEGEESRGLRFERTVEIETERGYEHIPKLTGKVGLSGSGAELEVAGYGRKTKKKDSLKVAGEDDCPLVRTLRSDTMGWIQWVICSSPLAGAGSVLQCSKNVSVWCHWPGEKTGAIRLYAPRYVYCVGQVAINPGAAMLAAFFHWMKGLQFRDDWREQHFSVVDSASGQ